MSDTFDYSSYEEFHDEIVGAPVEAKKVVVRLPDGIEVPIKNIKFEADVNSVVTCYLILGD